MTLKIPDEILAASKLNETEMLVELACHLFDAGRLSLGQAAKLAELHRTEFEDELHDRKIAAYRYGEEEFAQDQNALTKLTGRVP